MSRNRRVWSYEEYLYMKKRGRGQGHGIDYKPWITVYDFPSKGKVTRILGLKTGRLHHLLSSLERMHFIILDNDPLVVDIREQFPLPLGDTLRIAEKLKAKFPGMEHPKLQGFWYAMTTDFLVDTQNGLIARAVKPKEFLNDPKVQWKFAIEKGYWESQGIEWAVVTEDSLNRDLYMNYQWLNYGEPLELLIPKAQVRINAKKAFCELYLHSKIAFPELVEQFEVIGGFPTGTSIQIYKELIRENRIQVNLSEPVNLFNPVRDSARQTCCYF